MNCSMPASRASSTPYWITGLSTTGSISFGTALVAGRNRVPMPATGKTALRIRGVDMEGREQVSCEHYTAIQLGSTFEEWVWRRNENISYRSCGLHRRSRGAGAAWTRPCRPRRPSRLLLRRDQTRRRAHVSLLCGAVRVESDGPQILHRLRSVGPPGHGLLAVHRCHS